MHGRLRLAWAYLIEQAAACSTARQSAGEQVLAAAASVVMCCRSATKHCRDRYHGTGTTFRYLR